MALSCFTASVVKRIGVLFYSGDYPDYRDPNPFIPILRSRKHEAAAEESSLQLWKAHSEQGDKAGCLGVVVEEG